MADGPLGWPALDGSGVAPMSDLLGARSFLFAPGDDEHKLRRALESGADAVIADLEDSVPPAAKERARSVVAAVFGAPSSGPLRVLRVNTLDSVHSQADLALAALVPIAGIMVPKATPAGVARLPRSLPVLALVESAIGLRDSAQLAELEVVCRLALGSIDLAADVGLQPRRDGLELVYARSKLAVDSAAAGLPAPVDTVFPAYGDLAGFEEEARLARTLGMGGKLCIHPGQVRVANEIFSPTKEDIASARAVLASYSAWLESGKGVGSLEGEMVDMAMVKRAQRILADQGMPGGPG